MEIAVNGTTQEAMQTFLDSGMQIAKLECKTKKRAHAVYNSFAFTVRKRFNGQVKLHQRGTDVYFERT